LFKKILFLILAIIQCFSSTSNDVQTLASQLLIKQIHTTNDIPTFLYIYNQDGLKSSNIRICIKSIETLNDLLTKIHQHENLSPIFEILLQYFQDNKFRSNYNNILIRAVQHIKRILTPDLLKTYLESYPPSLRRLYYTYIPQQPENDLDDDDQTPRAPVQISQIKDSKGKIYNLKIIPKRKKADPSGSCRIIEWIQGRNRGLQETSRDFNKLHVASHDFTGPHGASHDFTGP
jgi:hypothetical protein